MRVPRLFAILLLTGFSAVAASADEPAAPKKIASVEGITEYRLANGMRVLLYPDASRPQITVALTVFVGSRHEGYGETGMAHLLEHMVFKGTPDHPRVDKVLRERGANYNGTTNSDRTNYFETLPASDDNLEFAIRFEADRLVNSFIKREDLASEMTVVRNEFEQGENSPSSILFQRIVATAYEWHNYGKSTIGNRSDIERVPIENLQAFYKKWYQPDNAMVVVAGQFDEAKALKFVTKYFGAIPKPERVLGNTYTEEPPQDGERSVTLRRVGDVGMVGLAYHIPAGPHPDSATLQVLANILTSPPTGRLYKALVEPKKATSASAFAQPQHDPGLMILFAEVPKGTPLEGVRDEMTTILDDVVAKGVTEAEVKRAVAELMAARERQSANTSGVAVQLSNWAAQGDWRLYFLQRDRIEKVTPEDVKAAAGRYFAKNNRTVGTFVPADKPERSSIPATPDVAKLLQDYKGRADVAQGEAFDPSYENIEKRTERSNLPDGVKVAILPKKTKGNQVEVQLTLRCGTEETLKPFRTASTFVGPLMTRGTRDHTYQQLREELTKQKATLSVSTSPGQLSASIQTQRDNLPKVLDLLREVLREPTFPAEEFEVIKKQRIANLEQSLKEPSALGPNKLAKELSPFPRESYHYVMTPEEQIEAVKAVTLDQVKAFYKDFVNGQHGELTIVGDFDKGPCLPIVAEMLAGWKAAKPYERVTNPLAKDVKPGRHVVNTPDKANAVYQSGLPVVMKQDHPDYPAMVMANYLLGSGPGSRLWDRVREKEGLSYGVGSNFFASAQDENGRFQVRAICNPANVEKVEKAVLDEIQRLIKEGVSQEELDKARQGYLQAQKTGRGIDGRLADLLGSDLHLGRTMGYHEDLEKKMLALTPGQVTEAFKKYIDPAKLVIVVAGDFAKTPGDQK